MDEALNIAIHDQLQGNLTAAKSQFNEVLKADPTNVYAHYNLGLIAQTQHQKVIGVGQYRLALQTNSNFEPALFNLAILQTPSAPMEAVALYQHAIAVEPNDANAHFNLGLLLVQTGQTSAGDAQVTEAIKLNPILAKRVPSTSPSNTVGPSGTPASSSNSTAS